MPRVLRSIGQVLKILSVDFPDVSISKIRFLESEGLITPERAPSGYRKYDEADIERLRYILDVQKNQYLPLKVIREHLEVIDNGGEPPTSDTTAATQPATPPPPLPTLGTGRAAKHPIHITRRELLRLSGLAEPVLDELERYALVVPRRGTVYYGRDALTVAVAARKLAAFGMDARHLRVIKQAAEREAALVDQATASHGGRSTAARQAVSDVLQLVLYAHAALLRSAIRH